MKDLKALSLGKKMKKGELKNVLGGGEKLPGVGCRCVCDDGGYLWIQYYMECNGSVSISTPVCGSYGSMHQLYHTATCTRAH